MAAAGSAATSATQGKTSPLLTECIIRLRVHLKSVFIDPFNYFLQCMLCSKHRFDKSVGIKSFESVLRLPIRNFLKLSLGILRLFFAAQAPQHPPQPRPPQNGQFSRLLNNVSLQLENRNERRVYSKS